MIRVGITTAAESAPTVGTLFAALGLHPVRLPCIRTQVAPERVIATMRQKADRADLVVLTSVTTLRLLWGERAPTAPVAAVGAATAEAVTARGGRVVIVGTSTGRSLAGDINATGMRIVFPHAHGTDTEMLRILATKAADFEAVPVYRSVPMSPPADPVDAVAFASPSAVLGWTSSRSLVGTVVGAIGQRTADQIEHMGGTVDVMPEVPRFELLARALSARMGARA